MADIVGAPLATETADYVPQLAGMGADKIVTVFNPLSQDFRVQYARHLAQTPIMSKGLEIAREKAALDLSKTQNIQAHAVQYHILKAGQMENLPADIAQMAVSQLVNHILMARAGKNNPKLIADPESRKQVESEVIVKVMDAADFMNQVTQPVQIPQPEVVTPEVESPNPPPGSGMTYEPGSSPETAK